MPDVLPAVRFACITDPTKRHAFFCATATEAFDRLAAAFDGEDVTVQPYEFTDPRIVAETHAWIADAQQNSARPPMVMVGSIEDGQWVNWQLPTATRPPVPSL